MDSGTIALYKKGIILYEAYLEGRTVNVIDPDGSIPSKKEIKKRLVMMKKAITKEDGQREQVGKSSIKALTHPY